MKIGYPRGLMNTQWEKPFLSFFKSLNNEIEKSPQSSHSLFLKGKKRILDEFCLPVKLFAGHVISIIEESDLPVFIPFISGNEDRNSFLCPIEIRITDILINSGLLPKERLISPRFIFDENLRLSFIDAIYPGDSFNIPFNQFRDNKLKTSPLSEKGSKEKPNILLLGRSYVLQDLWLNGGINKSLKNLGINVLVLDSSKQITPLSVSLSNFSHFALTAQILRGVERTIGSFDIDGIIVLTPFLCGPDCSLGGDIKRFISSEHLPPILESVLDEHHSKEGMQTRLEAFVDLITIKKNKKI